MFTGPVLPHPGGRAGDQGRFPTDDSPNGHGLSRRHLAAALDASLRRLGVTTIDLYQLHAWDPLTPLEETLRFLDDATRAGKIPASTGGTSHPRREPGSGKRRSGHEYGIGAGFAIASWRG